MSEIAAAAEAILFASGEPVEAVRIAEALGKTTEEVKTALAELCAMLDQSASGLELVRLADKYQLATRSRYADPIRSVLDKKRNAPLSPAAFEVLAVVAYNQPVTKAFIEQVRGVDCSGVIATLCQKSLIEECGRLDLPGRPLVYCTTVNFLRCFGISDLSELPALPGSDAAEAIKLLPNEAAELDGQMNMFETE